VATTLKKIKATKNSLKQELIYLVALSTNYITLYYITLIYLCSLCLVGIITLVLRRSALLQTVLKVIVQCIAYISKIEKLSPIKSWWGRGGEVVSALNFRTEGRWFEAEFLRWC